jgi:hypothetical protein
VLLLLLPLQLLMPTVPSVTPPGPLFQWKLQPLPLAVLVIGRFLSGFGLPIRFQARPPGSPKTMLSLCLTSCPKLLLTYVDVGEFLFC